MTLGDQAAAIVSRAKRMLASHEAATGDEALQLIVELTEIVIVLARDPMHSHLDPVVLQ